MLNIKSKKMLVRIVIACLCVCLTITCGAYILNNFISEASAATTDVSVSTASGWNSAMSSASSGDTVNVTLTADITTTAKLTAVPSGVTVNLYMDVYSITWDNVGSDASFMGTDGISSSSYTSGTYLGLITNNGDLTVTGTGTIRVNQTAYESSTFSKSSTIQRVAAIVNGSGTLTLGSGITVESYMTAFMSSSYWNYVFIYNFGIYNNSGGTVNSSASIKVGSMAGTYSGGTASRRFCFCYGIFGGEVNISGGTIDVQAKAGGREHASTGSSSQQTGAYAIGIYSNSATVMGANTSISAYTATWQGTSTNSKTGYQIEYAAGIMYTDTNYPVIGADVDVKATFCHASSDGTKTVVPGTSGSTETDVGTGETSDTYYTFYNSNNTSNRGQVAYAVVGITGAPTSKAIGTETSSYPTATDDFFGSGNTNTVTTATNGNWSTYLGYTTLDYIAEDAYYDYGRSSSYRITADYVEPSSTNQAEKGCAAIINGAPAGTNVVSGTTSYSNATPSQVGTQYVIIYRYYNNSISSSNVESVSYTYDSSIQKTSAYVTIGSSTDAVRTGVLPAYGTSPSSVVGGAVQNSNYYTLESTTLEKVASSTYAQRSIDDIDDWKTAGSTFASTSIGSNVTLVIYMNYVKKSPTAVRVAVADSGQTINYLSTGTSVTVDYTGSVLVPGTDFNIGIIDMGADTDINSNSTSDDTVVTGVYDISGSGSGSGNDSTAVTYRYSSDGGTTYSEGLPKNAGTYTIEVTVNADTTYAASGTYNRSGGTFYFKCTINKATATISGDSSKSGTYGATYGELIDTNGYTVTGKGSDTMTGTWTFSGLSSTDYPVAGTYSVTIMWTPTGDTENNYSKTSYSVSLTVNKRAVTVNVGACSVTYGDSSPTYVLEYENLASCDDTLKTGWLEKSTIQVLVNGTYTDYYAGLAAGTYTAQISSFGGEDNANNTFTLNTSTGSLTVSQRTLVYTASAANRAYNGSTTVDVTLTYASGIYGTDSYDATISTTGTVANANAAENKTVTVNTDDIELQNSNNYVLSVPNTPTVTICAADPTGVACATKTSEATYDSTKTLADYALETTSSDVAGTWAWKDSSIVPTVDVTTYKAVFTPTDTTNYNSIEQAVTLTISKAEVTVKVDAIELEYGDDVPSLSPTYSGFTGDDTIANVATTGTVSFTTTYTKGSAVGTYTISPATVTTALSATNYSFTAKESTITVNKKALTITAPDITITYGESVNLASYDHGSLAFDGFYDKETYSNLTGSMSLSTTYQAGNDAGTYAVCVSGYSSDNYEITYKEGTLTVNKAELTVTADSQEVTYGADVPTLTYTVSGYVLNDSADNVTITNEPSLTTTYSKGSVVNTYPISIDVSAMSSDNYTFTGTAGTITVSKATPAIDSSEVPSASVETGKTYADATFDTTNAKATNPNDSTINVAGTWSLQDSDTVAVYTGGDGTEITVTAVFTPADTTNYNTTTCNVYLLVTEKEVLGKPVVSGTLQVGQTLTVSVDSMDPSDSSYYSYQWYNEDGDVVSTGTSYTLTDSDVGQTFYVVATANANGYTGSGTSDTTDEVSALTLSILDSSYFSFTPDSKTYDGTETPVTVTSTLSSPYIGSITVKYDGDTTVPTDAGTYIITIDVASPTISGNDSTGYYAAVSGLELGTLTIDPATLTLTVSVSDKTYDGTTTATVLGTELSDAVSGDDVNVDTTNAHYYFEDASAGGSKTIVVSGVTLTGDDAANYTLTTQGTASIDKRTLTGMAYGVTRAYDGKTTVDVTITNIEGYADVDSASTVYVVSASATSSSANVGTWDLSGITYTLGGTSADNYTLSITNESSAQVTITKATPSNVDIPVIKDRTYDAGVTLKAIDLTGYETSAGYWTWDDESITPTVSTTSYAATYHSKDDNYGTYSTYITINVSPKTVTIKADDFTVTYGQTEPTYTVTASGLTGNDTLSSIGGYYTFACTYSAGQNVGDYPITVYSSLSDSNYTFETATGTLTVKPATVYVTASADDKTYDGTSTVTVNFAIDSGIYGNDSISLSDTSVEVETASANAGTYAVTYTAPTLQGTKAGNYTISVSPASGVLTVTINKKDVTGVIFPTYATVEYGNTLASATFTTSYSGDGTFAFSDTSTVFTTIGTFYNYEIVFTPTDAVNYNSQTYSAATVQVIKGQLNYVVGISGTAQSGEKLTTVITGMPTLAYDYVQYQWYRVSDSSAELISGATSSTYTATDDDVDYTLVVVTYFDSNAPYEFSATCDTETLDGTIAGIIGQTSSTIQEENLTFWQRILRWIYKLIAAITGISLSV